MRRIVSPLVGPTYSGAKAGSRDFNPTLPLRSSFKILNAGGTTSPANEPTTAKANNVAMEYPLALRESVFSRERVKPQACRRLAQGLIILDEAA